MPTQRYKITIAYRGTKYHGWQKQLPNEFYKGPPPSAVGMEGIPTIQEIIAKAISRIVWHPVNLVGSSRTDSGVHAKGQVAHFDSEKIIPAGGLMRAVNSRLPGDIAIRAAEMVPGSFDAITSTVSKRYQYIIWNTYHRPVFFEDLCYHLWRRPLDPAAMRDAAQAFVGTHDFAAFAKAGHGRESTVRTVLRCDVSWRGPRIVIGVEGTGFLWNQVRIMVGTLVDVGLGRWNRADIQRLIQDGDRRMVGNTAPAQGLYLQWIKMRQEPMPFSEASPVQEPSGLPTADDASAGFKPGDPA